MINYRDYFTERGSGIYKITCLISGKSYIGQAKNIYFRIRRHCQRHLEVTNKYTYKKVLYRAIRKHGLENFTCEIIAKCPPEYLDKLEVHFIKHYNSYYKGYNSDKGGSGGGTPRHTEEQKRKWSIARKGVKPSKETIAKRSKTIENRTLCFNFKGELLKEYSHFDKAIKDGFHGPNIAKACKFNNGTNFYKGHYWMKKEEFEKYGFISKDSKKIGIDYPDPRWKPLYCYDLNGNFIQEFISLRHAKDDKHYHTYISISIKQNKPYHNMYWALEKKEVLILEP